MNCLVMFGVLGCLLLAGVPLVVELVTQRQFTAHLAGGVVITGASSGIGRHAALALARQGYTVFACVRKEADKKSLVEQAAAGGAGSPNMHPILLDVVDQPSIEAAAVYVKTYLKKRHLPLVALVNNAGIGGQHFPVELAPQKAVYDIFNTNLFGVFRVTAAFIPLLRGTDGARIVNIGSVNGVVSTPYTSIYASSKWALEALTDSLRMELTPWNISVSLVEPAYVATSMGKKSTGENDPFKKLPASQFALYKSHFSTFSARRAANFEGADTPEVTTAAIVHAISDPYPNTRYVVARVGKVPAWLLVWASRLAPDRLADLIKLRM